MIIFIITFYEKDLSKCIVPKLILIYLQKNVALVLGKLNVPLFYISTDYVFNGDNSPYKETDEPTPINEYGRLKLLGENEILAANQSMLFFTILNQIDTNKLIYNKILQKI